MDQTEPARNFQAHRLYFGRQRRLVKWRYRIPDNERRDPRVPIAFHQEWNHQELRYWSNYGVEESSRRRERERCSFDCFPGHLPQPYSVRVPQYEKYALHLVRLQSAQNLCVRHASPRQLHNPTSGQDSKGHHQVPAHRTEEKHSDWRVLECDV